MEIQELKKKDVGLLLNIQPKGWQSLLPSFDFYTESAFCFPIKVSIRNKIVGVGASIIHDDVAWLAHIVVGEENRNKGIGGLICQRLIDLSDTKKCKTIYLIATNLGTPVYEKKGFITEAEYVHYKDISNEKDWTASNHIELFTHDLKDQIAYLDKEVSGENRLFHIEQHLKDAFVFNNNNTVEGFYLPSFGDGVIIANTNTAGLELMKLRLATQNNAFFPSNNLAATNFLNEHNYKYNEKVKRMRLGKERRVIFANIYNRIGGNLG